MTVTKLVKLDEDYNREMYISRIDKLSPDNGLRVYGVMFTAHFTYDLLRSVDDTSELQIVRINYQTK